MRSVLEEIPRILERSDVEMSTTDLFQNNLIGRVVWVGQDARSSERAPEGLNTNNGEEDDGKDDVESNSDEHRPGDLQRMQNGAGTASNDQQTPGSEDTKRPKDVDMMTRSCFLMRDGQEEGNQKSNDRQHIDTMPRVS